MRNAMIQKSLFTLPSFFQAFSAIFCLTLFSCTNGMMGMNEEELTPLTQLSNETLSNSSLPSVIHLKTSNVIGNFKAYGTDCASPQGDCDTFNVSTPNQLKIGAIINVEEAALNISSEDNPGWDASTLSALKDRAHQESAVGNIPVVLELLDPIGANDLTSRRMVYFQFKEMVTTGKLFKNALVIFPNTETDSHFSETYAPRLLRTEKPLPQKATIAQLKSGDLVIAGGIYPDGSFGRGITLITTSGSSKVLKDVNGSEELLSQPTGKAIILTTQFSSDIREKYLENQFDLPYADVNFYSESVPDLSEENRTALDDQQYFLVITLKESAQSWPQPISYTNGSTNQTVYSKFDGCTFHTGSALFCPHASDPQPEILFKNNLLSSDLIFFKTGGRVTPFQYCSSDAIVYSPFSNFSLFSRFFCTASRRMKLLKNIINAEWRGDFKFDHIQNGVNFIPFIGSTSYGNQIFGNEFFQSPLNPSSGFPPIPVGGNSGAQLPDSKIIIGPGTN